MSSGEITFPADFDIFIPLPSTTKPCDNMLSKGALPLVPQDSSKEEWNQPLCWSEPSRYMSAGHLRSFLFSKTKLCVEPLSNHTSTISVNFSKSSAL